MSIKIAIPNNAFYEPLVKNRERVAKDFDAEIFPVSEEQCGSLLLGNRVDLALVSPLGYGKGVAKTDYKIVPGPAVTLHAYTGTASIYFRESAQDMNKCATEAVGDFLVQAGLMVLNEKYDISPSIVQAKGSPEELLRQADVAIAWGDDDRVPVALDISEDWFDTFEFPMPLAFWVYRNDEADNAPENLRDIVKAMAGDDLPGEERTQEFDREGRAVQARIGKIEWQWTPETEHMVFQTLQLLYFHQLLSEIPAVKILGRD